MLTNRPYRKEGDINIYLENLNREQRLEDDHFRTSESESPAADLYKSLFIKIQFLLLFDSIVSKYRLDFSGSLLELGGGYGYLSAYIKKRFKGVSVVYSDVSKEALKKSCQYEDFFGVKLDGKWVMSAEDVPFQDNTFDSVLFFASFHHVQNPQAALKECARVLKPGGKLLLMLEPSCPAYLKPIFKLHVKRPDIKENFYSVSEYGKFLKGADFAYKQYNFKNFTYRWLPRSTIYYMLLNLIPNFLTGLFPCSQVIVAQKK